MFNGERNAAAVKNKYMRMRTVFMNILRFEKWTGGGGDPDLVPPDNWHTLTIGDIERRLEKGRKAGREYGDLTAQVYKLWQAKGWYDLFNDMYVFQTIILDVHCASVTNALGQAVGASKSCTGP